MCYRRLWARIALILLAIVTLPVVLLGFMLINTSQEAVRKSVLNNHTQIVIRTAGEIGLFVKRPLDILSSTSAILSAVYPAPWKQETVLVELALNDPMFMRISSFDMAGRELAGSELGSGAKVRIPEEAWEELRLGKPYISEVSIFNNHTPYLTMAVPIKKLGVVAGVLAADVNLRDMWKIIDAVGVGATGRAFLVSRDGILIAHRDKKRVLKNENLKDEKEVQLVLGGKTDAAELSDTKEGKVISSYAPIPGVGWGVILRQKQDEAYFFSRVMKMQSWIIIILGELLAIAVSVFMGKKFASPIKNLAFRIKRVAEGDFDHAIKMQRRDDMGELIRSFNEMTKKLKEAKEKERLSTIGEAAARITHELKNSFASIKTFIQLLPKRNNDERFIEKFNRLVPREINRLELMFKELSDFSSHLDLVFAKTDVKGMLGDMLELMKEELAARKIDVQLTVPVMSCEIEADTKRLKEVFLNMIMNAMQAMPQGGTLRVSLGPAANDHLEVKVQDTGLGIPEEKREKIFEPFYTTKNGGMGLGLSICRKIVESHGGRITAEGRVDKGATFIIRLPIAARTPAGQRRLVVS